MNDVYAQLRNEVAGLWEMLKKSSRHQLFENSSKIHRQLSLVHGLAVRIGGRVQIDYHQLKHDIDRFLAGELTEAEIDRMFQDALKIEQDTREL